MHQPYLARDDDVTTIRLRDKQWWVYRHFYKSYDNQTWYDGRPVSTGKNTVTLPNFMV